MMFSPDYVIPTDDDFETVPHESILLKLEATPDGWLHDSTLRDGPAAYDEAMRRELATWGPEQPWTEGDDTWDTRANSKNKLNLMYFGSRSDLQPRHSELFLEDTEFEEAAIAMWNIPKHTAMRARDATRTMVDDQVVDVGDRSLTATGLINAKRHTNHRFVNSFKNFSTQDQNVQMNNNTVMGRIRHDLSYQDESLKTYRPTGGANKNYSAVGPKTPSLIGKGVHEVSARMGAEGHSRGAKHGHKRGNRRMLGSGQNDHSTPSPQVANAQKKSVTPKDIGAIYQMVVDSQTRHGGTANAPLGKSGRQGDSRAQMNNAVEGAQRTYMGTEGGNRTNQGPQYAAGAHGGVDGHAMVMGPGAIGVIGKSTAMATPVSLTTLQQESGTHVYVSNARMIAKGLRGGYDPAKARVQQDVGAPVMVLSDRRQIAKAMVPLLKHHGKTNRMRDHTAGIREGRAYIDAGSSGQRKLGPGAVPHGGDRGKTQYNQQRTLALQNSGKKVKGLDEPVARQTKIAASVNMRPIEGEQKLMSMQKKMGTKRLRASDMPDAADIGADDNGLWGDEFEDDDFGL
jgi:hypothetical protein